MQRLRGAASKCETVAAAKGGEACGIVNNTLTLCIVGNSCPGMSLIPLQTMGVCPNPAGDGKACTDTVHCLPPANCVGGLCRLPEQRLLHQIIGPESPARTGNAAWISATRSAPRRPSVRTVA